MGRRLQRFNQTIKRQDNIENKKTSKVKLRKPLNDKTNLLIKDHIRPHNDKDEVLITLASVEACKGTNKPVTRFNLNKKRDADVKNLLPVVQLQNISIDEITKHSNFNSSHICLQRLSSEDVSKHLKECYVIVSDMSHNVPEESCIVNENDTMSLRANKENKRLALRKRKKIDYAERNRGSSLLNEDVKPTDTKHIPVYKHKIDEKRPKRKDIYEFDSDSEKKKKKRRRSSSNSSTPFDKEMKIVMRKIEEKEHKQLRRGRKNGIKTNKKKLRPITVAATENIDVIVQDRKKSTRGDVNNLEHKQASNSILNELHIKPAEPAVEEIHDNESDLSDFDTAPLELEICTNNKSTSLNIANKVPANTINIIQNINLSKYVNNEMNRESISNKSKVTNLHHQTNEKDPFDALLTEDNDELFEVDTLETPQAKSTPWRPDLQVKRNPFFLQYKDTLLPSYNQDMVIDSIIMEKFSMGNKTPKNNTHPNTKQTSILSYVNGKSLLDSPDIIESSLYDMHELSPIKSVTNSAKESSKRSPDKENLFLRIEDTPFKENHVSKAKRQILGERVNNSENIANNSSAKALSNNQNSNEDTQVTYFGFDGSSNRDNEENALQKSKKCVWLFGKPMRLEDYLMITKTSKDKAVNTNFNKNNSSVELDEYLEKDNDEEDSNAIGEKEPISNLRLFEDLEPIRNDVARKYERARRRRVRKHSIDFEEEHDENEQIHPRKKKHDKRTKHEEEEAEKWAKEFNRMCEEVEEYPLEIE